MTPDERRRTMDFILRSQADAAIRMDQMDQRSHDRDEQLELLSTRFQVQDARIQSELDDLKLDVAALVSASQDLVTVSRTLLESDRQIKRRLDRLEK